MTNLLAHLLTFFDKASKILALFTGGLVLLLALLICYDIVARSGFGQSVQGTDELGGYVLAFVGSLGLSFTLIKRSHPRIDLGLNLLPKAFQAPLHILAYGALSAMGFFMTWHAASELGQTIRFNAVTNTPLQTPLWLPQGLWLLGTGFFAITALTCTLHALSLLLTGEAKRANALYGTPTVQEELDNYLDETTAESR